MSLDRIGRDGYLGLRFARRGLRTVLVRSRFTLPLQVLAPLALEDGSISLALLNPTGGLLGGDRLTTEIVLEENAHVCLTTPSATRVYRADNLPATQDTFIRVGEGATLEYFPDHLIPHAGAALRQSLRVEIAASGCALLWEAMACGRVARGERWSFREIISDVAVFIRGQPAWLNRTKIDPTALTPERPGIMEAYSYGGSLAVLADGFTLWPRLVAEMNREFAGFPEVHGGVSKMAGDGCLARLLAKSAIDLTEMSTTLWAAARARVLSLPAFAPRKY